MSLSLPVLLAVIPLQHSEARVRSWHGRLGKHNYGDVPISGFSPV